MGFWGKLFGGKSKRSEEKGWESEEDNFPVRASKGKWVLGYSLPSDPGGLFIVGHYSSEAQAEADMESLSGGMEPGTVFTMEGPKGRRSRWEALSSDSEGWHGVGRLE